MEAVLTFEGKGHNWPILAGSVQLVFAALGDPSELLDGAISCLHLTVSLICSVGR